VSDSDIVVDASAVLALLQREPFTKLEPERLVGAWISAVNLSEVLARLGALGLTEADADQALAALDLRVVSFDETQARGAARMWLATRQAGLSLGDRACLATASALDVPAVTADRAWARLDLGARVIVVR
jgi:ribonuclease VapC